MIKSQLVSLGARIPADLKKKLANYCDRNGIKLQFFVTQAIKEKLSESEEERIDLLMAQERLKDADFFDSGDMQKYLRERKDQG